MITHVKFVGIPVADQERALRFYTEKLGFEVLTDSPMGTQRWIELQCGRAETGVEFTKPPEKAPWGTFATFKDSEGNLFVLSSR